MTTQPDRHQQRRVASSSPGESSGEQPDGIDPRGPQFNAILTSVALALTLLTAPGAVGIAILSLQTALFGIAVAFGAQRTPAAYVFKRFVRPQLARPTHLEDPRPPRFAQAVGLPFAVVGLVGYLSGAALLGAVAIGFALTAALLNAVFGFCLGCELYLLGKRVLPTRTTSITTEPTTPPNAPQSAGKPADNTKEEEAFA